VPTAKIRFVLNRIESDGKTKDEIIILTKLNGMKIDFINLNELIYNDMRSIKLSISSKAIDAKTFEVNFLRKNKIFDWDKIKDLFYYGGNTRTLERWASKEMLLRLTECVGASKTDLFASLNRAKILNGLNNKEANN